MASFEKELDRYLDSIPNHEYKHYIVSERSGFADVHRDPLFIVDAYVQMAINEIYYSLPLVLTSPSTSRPIKREDLIPSRVNVDSKGQYVVTLSWNPNAVRRQSLLADQVGGGIDEWIDGYYLDNIVELFANGYHASKHVYGTWYDHAFDASKIRLKRVARREARQTRHSSSYTYIRSKISRRSNAFLKRAVNSFNSKYRGEARLEWIPYDQQ